MNNSLVLFKYQSSIWFIWIVGLCARVSRLFIVDFLLLLSKYSSNLVPSSLRIVQWAKSFNVLRYHLCDWRNVRSLNNAVRAIKRSITYVGIERNRNFCFLHFYVSTSSRFDVSDMNKGFLSIEIIYLFYRKRCLDIMATGLLTFECYHSDMERKPTRRWIMINSAVAGIELSVEGTRNLLSMMN